MAHSPKAPLAVPSLRIAVISDTHLPRGRRALPRECLAELERAELVLHVGDVVTAPVLADLTRFGPLEAVHGNMDDAELRATLPKRRVVAAGGIRIGMVHDPGPRSGREARLLAGFPDCQAVLYGHTHVPQVTQFAGVWLLNPGSPTERRRAPARSLLVLDVEEETLGPRLVELP